MRHSIKAEAVLLELGPFPAETVNLTLGMELEPGAAVLTAVVQKHVLQRHRDDYPKCLPHVAGVIANALFIGDDFHNPGTIELISRIPSLGAALLVAVCVEINGDRQYEVRSFYPISEKKIENRLAKGFLKRAQKR